MQRSAFRTVSLLTLVGSAALLSTGCSDLGNCDEFKGRTTVVVGGVNGQLLYTGQAILYQSCATGCHSSSAKGDVRRGAPADLNFDLYPLKPGAPIKDGQGNVVAVQLDPVQLAGLRTRQRTVYEQRQAIWDQVKDGLMPPTKYSNFKSLSGIMKSMFGPDGKCTGGGAALTTLDADKEELRNWLACDTPVVETTSSDLPYKAPASNAPPEDKAAGSVYYATTDSVGYQYPSCGGDGGTTPGGEQSFSDLFTTILKPQCGSCHSALNPTGVTLEFNTTEDAAYVSLMGANGMGKPQGVVCAGNSVPYVTPGDPAKSYLLPKMDKAKMSGVSCGDLMPQPIGSDPPAIKKVRDWIMAGALRQPAGGGGGDAGAADAGAADAAKADSSM
jgi:hypothetical protein